MRLGGSDRLSSPVVNDAHSDQNETLRSRDVVEEKVFSNLDDRFCLGW